MAKKAQTFAEKTARHGGEAKKMAKLVLSEKKPNGHFSFRTKMVSVDEVKSTLAQAKS
jgi:hypothetical protein